MLDWLSVTLLVYDWLLLLRDVHNFWLVVLVVPLVPKVSIFATDLTVLRRRLLHDAAPT